MEHSHQVFFPAHLDNIFCDSFEEIPLSRLWKHDFQSYDMLQSCVQCPKPNLKFMHCVFGCHFSQQFYCSSRPGNCVKPKSSIHSCKRGKNTALLVVTKSTAALAWGGLPKAKQRKEFRIFAIFDWDIEGALQVLAIFCRQV